MASVLNRANFRVIVANMDEIKNIEAPSTSSCLNTSSWEDRIDIINIYTYFPERPCEVFAAQELSESYQNVMTQLHSASASNLSSCLKLITYEDVVDFCLTYSIDDYPNYPEKEYTREACEVAKVYLSHRKSFPFTLLAKIIKYYIIFVLYKDVMNEKKEAFKKEQVDGETLMLLENIEEIDEKKPKNKSKKEKKSEKSKEKKSKKGKKSKKPKQDETAEAEDICNTITTENNNNNNKPIDTSEAAVSIENKHIQIVLTNFFDARFVLELDKISVYVLAVVEISRTNTNLENVEDTVGRTLAQIMTQDSIAARNVASSTSNQSKHTQSEETDAYYNTNKSKSQLLYDYWILMHKCLEGKCYHKLFEGIFHLRYIPLDLQQYCDSMEITFEEAAAIQFRCFEGFMREQPDHIERKYMHYLSQLQYVRTNIEELGTSYKEIVDNMPPECFNVNVYAVSLLDYLVDTFQQTPNSRSSQMSFDQEIYPESYFFPREAYTDQVPQMNTPMRRRHKSLEEQIECVLEKTKEKRLYKQWNTTQEQSASSALIDERPYSVHEANHLEMSLNSYPLHFNKLFNANIEVLKQMPPLLLFRNYQKQCNSAERLFELEYLIWSKTLDVRQVIADNVKQYAIDFMTCTNNVQRLNENFETHFSNILPPAKLEKFDRVQFSNMREQNEIEQSSTRPDEASSYSWCERLEASVSIQLIQQDWMHFNCIDHIYEPTTDSILLWFHNTQQDGIHEEYQVLKLETACCVRDFTKFTMHEHGDWMKAETSSHEQNIRECAERAVASALRLYENEFNNPQSAIYWLRNIDFTFPSSLKDIAKRRTPMQEEISEAKRKETVDQGVQYVEIPFPQVTVYDLDHYRHHFVNDRSFHYTTDGMSVTVDYSSWSNAEMPLKNNFSLHLTAKKNTLHLYPSRNEPFKFHISLADGSYVNFSKATKLHYSNNANISLDCSQIRLNVSPKKRIEWYYTVEKEIDNIKCLGFPLERKIGYFMLPKSEFELINQGSITESGKSQSISNLETELETFSRSSAANTIGKSTPSISFLDDDLMCSEDGEITYIMGENELFKKESTMSTNSRTLLSASDVDVRMKSKIFKQVKSALEEKLPCFVVCSSKYLKNKYIKPKNMHLNLHINDLKQRLTLKPTLKTKSFTVKKIYPLDLIEEEEISSHPYNIEITLPSGLHIATEPGFNHSAQIIKQFYTDKGPQCEQISDEKQRVFFRNGSVLVKKTDGTLLIYFINGTIFSFDTPCFLKASDIKLKTPKKRKYKQSNPPKLTKYYKQLYKNWKQHLIGTDTVYRKSRRSKLRGTQLPVNKYQTYLAEIEGTTIYPKYNIISFNGKKYKIVKGKQINTSRMYVESECDYLKLENITIREDGTRTLSYPDGTNIVEYPDQTRIKSWYDVEDKTVYLSSDDEEYSGDFEESKAASIEESAEFISETQMELIYQNEDVSKSSSDPVDTVSVSSCSSTNRTIKFTKPQIKTYHVESDYDSDWVVVNLQVKISHPNYASVYYNSKSKDFNLTLPNNMTLASNERETFVSMDKYTVASIAKHLIKFEHHLCLGCSARSRANLNIKPLYENQLIVPLGEELLVTRDSNNKIFVLDYEGHCHTQDDAISTCIKLCTDHRQLEKEKIYALERGLTSTFFINNLQLENISVENRFREILKMKGKDKIIIYEALRKAYCNRFTIPYSETKIHLTYKCVIHDKVAYVTLRTLVRLYNLDTLKPIFRKLKIAPISAISYHCHLLPIEELVKIFLEDISRDSRISEDQSVAKDNLLVTWQKYQINLDNWRQECDSLKDTVRQGCAAALRSEENLVNTSALDYSTESSELKVTQSTITDPVQERIMYLPPNFYSLDTNTRASIIRKLKLTKRTNSDNVNQKFQSSESHSTVHAVEKKTTEEEMTLSETLLQDHALNLMCPEECKEFFESIVLAFLKNTHPYFFYFIDTPIEDEQFPEEYLEELEQVQQLEGLLIFPFCIIAFQHFHFCRTRKSE